MTNQLNYFGPFAGNTGYATVARNMVPALSGVGIDVSVLPDTKLQRREDFEAIEPFLPNPDMLDPEATSLCHSVPRGLELAKMHGKKRYSYSVLEVDKIPEVWVDNLNRLDGVMTATKWGKKVYEKCGVKKASVVPHGVDTERFSPFGKALDKIEALEKPVFLAIGKFEPRKGYDILLRAFAKEFGKKEEAYMLVQFWNPFIPEFNPHAALLSLDLPTYKNIEMLQPEMPAPVLARLYNSVTAFVLPTRGEGWGMPITEAMATGLPVVATNWSGPTEYMTEKNSYPLSYTGLSPVPENEMFYHFLKGGNWADPDEKELRALMRHIIDNPDEAAKKGKQARRDMRDKWSWHSAATKMSKVIFGK